MFWVLFNFEGAERANGRIGADSSAGRVDAARQRWHSVDNREVDGSSPFSLTNGGLAQLGEHLLCKQGVKGSIPLISTKMGKGKSQTNTG